ncbi:proline and serine-rich protein 3 isoform X2 [Trachemys scripta elegans]|uniref:proline and serine-rich protein 3 isoform X2 n=1 Tax=Trachemys scripta elegans TaxID=31138 RepID=UPI0015577E0E|nr:proline and serine-rich protein 3 isoform X2 [Trachemys scripta elegans]
MVSGPGTLSPARLLTGVPALAPHRWRPPEPMASSPPDLSFLQGSSCRGTTLDLDSTNPFPESWSSTERSSSSTPQEVPALRQSLGPLASAQDGESIIAKYIERFRHGQPRSRSQRQAPPVPTAREFWWLEPAPPSDSSTPKGGAKPDCAKLEEARPGWALVSPPLRSMGGPSDTSPLESPDPDSHSLQERAIRLLLRSESSLSSTIPVSSEGLRSTPPSSTADSDQALPCPSHLSLLEPSPEPLPLACWPPAHIPQCSSSTRPEDDILFQWRLRRKMEQASQAGRSLPLLGWRTKLARGPRTGDGVCMARPGVGLLPSAVAWRSGDAAAFPAPAVQPEMRSGLEWALGPSALRQGMGHPLEVPFLSAKPAVGQNPIAVHVLGQLASAATPSSTPQPEGNGGGAAERWSSQDAWQGMGPAERPGSQDSRRGAGPVEQPISQDAQWAAGPSERPGSRDARRAAGPAERPGSRDARWAAGPTERHGSQDAKWGAWAMGVAQHIPKETEQPSKPQPWQDRAATKPEATPSWRRRGRKGESSIHSALGQVISERLFSPPASHLPTRGRQSGEGAVSPPEQSAAEELLAPGSQHPQLLQLAVQLLEEAEESDGTEFEEDPLLEVLRGQREDLRSQLRAVDIAVSRLVSQGLAEPPGRPC